MLSVLPPFYFVHVPEATSLLVHTRSSVVSDARSYRKLSPARRWEPHTMLARRPVRRWGPHTMLTAGKPRPPTTSSPHNTLQYNIIYDQRGITPEAVEIDAVAPLRV